jgi:hypothetical protein
VRREHTHNFSDYNRPRGTRDHAALEAIDLVEELLDIMPDLDLNPRNYERLINAYARRLREENSRLEHQLLHDWGEHEHSQRTDRCRCLRSR